MSSVSEKNKKRNIKPDRLSSSKQKDSAQKAVQKSAKALESRVNHLEDIEKKKQLNLYNFQQVRHWNFIIVFL